MRHVTGAVDAENGQFSLISCNGVIIAMSLGYDANAAGLNVLVNPVSDTFVIDFMAGMNLGSNALKSIQISFAPTPTPADFTLGAVAVVPELPPTPWLSRE